MPYACPRCQTVSHNPRDEGERFCGACGQFGDERAQRTAATVAYLRFLLDPENGYAAVRVLPDGRWSAIRADGFVTAIVSGAMFDRTGVDRRWDYLQPGEAAAAFAHWDGTGEPDGWVREPFTRRRRSQSADEYDEDGKRVGEIGVIYVRR